MQARTITDRVLAALGSGEFDFITGAEEWKKHSEYSHDKEALVYVVSAGGSLGRSHYVNGKFIASNLCLISTFCFTAINLISLMYL